MQFGRQSITEDISSLAWYVDLALSVRNYESRQFVNELRSSIISYNVIWKEINTICGSYDIQCR